MVAIMRGSDSGRIRLAKARREDTFFLENPKQKKITEQLTLLLPKCEQPGGGRRGFRRKYLKIVSEQTNRAYDK
jgi:hypothetical protein